MENNNYIPVLNLNPATPPIHVGKARMLTFVSPESNQVKSIYVGASVMNIIDNVLFVKRWVLEKKSVGLGYAVSHNWIPQNGTLISNVEIETPKEASAVTPMPPSVEKGFYSVKLPNAEKQMTFKVIHRFKRAWVAVKVGHYFVSIGNLYGSTINFWKKAYYNGSPLDMPYPTTEIEANFAAVVADLKGAGLAYSRESNTCYRCNRMLTDLESIETGLGPECRKKVTYV